MLDGGCNFIDMSDMVGRSNVHFYDVFVSVYRNPAHPTEKMTARVDDHLVGQFEIHDYFT